MDLERFRDERERSREGTDMFVKKREVLRVEIYTFEERKS